jgi:hypothetical protein
MGPSSVRPVGRLAWPLPSAQCTAKAQPLREPSLGSAHDGHDDGSPTGRASGATYGGTVAMASSSRGQGLKCCFGVTWQAGHRGQLDGTPTWHPNMASRHAAADFAANRHTHASSMGPVVGSPDGEMCPRHHHPFGMGCFTTNIIMAAVECMEVGPEG